MCGLSLHFVQQVFNMGGHSHNLDRKIVVTDIELV